MNMQSTGAGRPSSSARQAIAAVLQRLATRSDPMSAEVIATRAGVSIKSTRSIISNMLTAKDAERTNPGAKPATYAWAHPLPAQRAELARHVPTGDYQPPAPFSARPGALDAYALPSLQNGERVPHRAPCGMSSRIYFGGVK